MKPVHLHSLHELCTLPFKRPENAQVFWRDLGGPPNWRGDHNADYWLGASTATEAAKRVTDGWPEGAKRVLSNMADLDVPPAISVQRRLQRSDQGAELDIHALYRSDFQHAWSSRQRRHIRNPLSVRLIAQCNLLAHTSFGQLFWRGAAVVKLADVLTSAGYNVEIVGAIASERVRGAEGDFLVTFPLKELGAPLDVEQLAGVVCNAGFHRLYGFRTYCALADGSHGSTGAASSDDSGRILTEYIGTDERAAPTFVTPYGVGSQGQAETWVASIVGQLNNTREDV